MDFSVPLFSRGFCLVMFGFILFCNHKELLSSVKGRACLHGPSVLRVWISRNWHESKFQTQRELLDAYPCEALAGSRVPAHVAALWAMGTCQPPEGP